MAGRHFLHIPGPTNVPERIQRAMLRSIEDHRGAHFPNLSKSILADLPKIFRTDSAQVFIFPSSGTGAWEASLLNTLAPGDKVLVSRFGTFSHLWADMCERLELDVTVLDAEWGEAAPVERYAEALRADTAKTIKAVLVCHNETATGVTSDIAGIRRALDEADHPALLYVDGVSSIGSIDFRMDDWGVDLAVTGSQKGLMMPPGLGIVAVSQKALAAREGARLRRCYFDFGDMIRMNADGWFPYTPATGLLYGLREALDMFEEEGLDNVIARHHRLAEGVRRGVAAWGLSLCAKEKRWESDTVSAVVVPEGHDAAKVIEIAYHKYNLALGAGLMKVAGKVFRIGHLGDLNELMCLAALSGSEMAMRDAGIPIVLGSGVAAAQAWYAGEQAQNTASSQPERQVA